MRSIDADELKEHKFTTQCANGVEIYDVDVVPVGVIDNAPTIDPVQKVVVVQPEIIKSVADAIVDTIYKLDWDKIIKMYRGGSCKGEWITNELHNTVCSICGGIRRDSRFDHIDFCNKCGADMRVMNEQIREY